MAPDTISARDVSISCKAQLPTSQDFQKKGAPCAVLLLGSLAHLVFTFDFQMCRKCVHFSNSFTSKSGLRPSIFSLLTSTCASRHSCMRFFDISTSKSAPAVTCFAHFDFKICSAPQPRAIFSSLISTDGSAPAALASLLWPSGATKHWEKHSVSRLSYLFARLYLSSDFSLLWSFSVSISLMWLFPPLLFHLSILSEVWLLTSFQYVN